ncbi:MAG: hypothetical protein Q9210_004902 [Variospora velana]
MVAQPHFPIFLMISPLILPTRLSKSPSALEKLAQRTSSWGGTSRQKLIVAAHDILVEPGRQVFETGKTLQFCDAPSAYSCYQMSIVRKPVDLREVEIDIAQEDIFGSKHSIHHLQKCPLVASSQEQSIDGNMMA